jgi:phosphatidylinositol-3-phosphatase
VTESNRTRARLWATVAVASLAVGVLLVAGLVAATNAAESGSTPSEGTAAPPVPTAHAPLPTPIQHVFLILMENEETSVIYGKQPFQTSLANNYSWAGNANSNKNHTGYYAVCHPSAPNYLALTSGLPLQCNSDAYHTYPVNNLGNELDQANESWVDYEESATVPCQTTSVGLYAVKHNPFPYYSDLGGPTPGSECYQHALPIANLTQDYPYSATPPAFTYIAPNLLNDAHSSSAAVGDLFLSQFIPKLEAQPWFSSTVIFITYDEAYTEKGFENFTGYDGLWGGPVYTVAVSPYTLGVGTLHGNNSHYDLLSTIEWLLGLPGTGSGHDMTSQFPVMTGLFQSRLFSPGVDMESSDLIGVSLPGVNLAGADFKFANLADTDLAGANLAGADLAQANLAGANLTGADLRGANLDYADLAGATLSGADARGATFFSVDLYGATLTGLGPTEPTDFNGAGFGLADLQDAVCGTPNYIEANGATLGGILMVPTSCKPPL